MTFAVPEVRAWAAYSSSPGCSPIRDLNSNELDICAPAIPAMKCPNCGHQHREGERHLSDAALRDLLAGGNASMCPCTTLGKPSNAGTAQADEIARLVIDGDRTVL
jgi:hypothetical protein